MLPSDAAPTAVRRESGERLKQAMLSLGPTFVKGERWGGGGDGRSV